MTAIAILREIRAGLPADQHVALAAIGEALSRLEAADEGLGTSARWSYPQRARDSAPSGHRPTRFVDEFVDNRVASRLNAPDHRGCLDQSKTGGAPVTVRPDPPPAEGTYPQSVGGESPVSWTSDEARAFEHEHARLYEALKVAEERAELAGHTGQAEALRRMRAAVAEHVAYRWCEP